MAARLRAALLLLGAVGATSTVVFPGDGYDERAYEWLSNDAFPTTCVSHSASGAAAAVQAVVDQGQCKFLIMLGAAPDEDQLQTIAHVPVLLVAGTLDGVTRMSSFAAARHKSLRSTYGSLHRYVVVAGASHHSFAGGGTPPQMDLQPALSASAVHAMVRDMAHDFVSGGRHRGALAAGEALAARVAAPLVAALELEGSSSLGGTACNSDFPTNPTCNYPKYPDFSLPPGPSPAPAPLPPVDCICGSKWITDVAAPLMAGADLAASPFQVVAKDAFHDVSDEHPFHLPHVWNSCENGGASCILNITTLTMPVVKAGQLFPNASSPPLSALELRAKLKSRQVIWEAAGLGSHSDLDKNMTICRAINQRAWDWALGHAEASVRARFEADGEPMIMVDDKAAPIGITGPTWIKDELVFTRVTDGNANQSHIEVQSWQFVVGDFPIKTKYLPAGMHYCKLLSPARAMEWIYTDSLRMRRAIGA